MVFQNGFFLQNFIQNAKFKMIVETEVAERHFTALWVLVKLIENKNQFFVFSQFFLNGGQCIVEPFVKILTNIRVPIFVKLSEIEQQQLLFIYFRQYIGKLFIVVIHDQIFVIPANGFMNDVVEQVLVILMKPKIYFVGFRKPGYKDGV
ncbi:hypothetical protein SDC9_168327 [bioreactor metagenome]|uniref:Uncharacterized protein n=1 Tax=bioreactor metagenome TaxID=1076179 RepID=A0A645G267_9ZZZZ